MASGKEEECSSSLRFGMLVPLVVFLVVALAGMYIISSQAKPQNVYFSTEPVKNIISVKGGAKATVAPNELQLSFTIETNDTSARRAQESNAQLTERVKRALIAAGLTEQNLETTQFSVEPIRRSRWSCPDPADMKCDYYDRVYYDEIIGYRTTHSMLVKSGNTAAGGELLDAANSAGGNELRVNYILFTLKDETRKLLEKQLLEAASQDAKAKAQRIASGMGVGVGTPTQVAESISYPYYYDYAYKSAEAISAQTAPAAATQVFGGQIDVSASITASFEVS